MNSKFRYFDEVLEGAVRFESIAEHQHYSTLCILQPMAVKIRNASGLFSRVVL